MNNGFKGKFKTKTRCVALGNQSVEGQWLAES